MSETKLRQQTADGSLQQTQAERDSIGICCRLPSENCCLKPLLEAAEEVFELRCPRGGKQPCCKCSIRDGLCHFQNLKAAVERAKRML